jgi:hypothetical protein
MRVKKEYIVLICVILALSVYLILRNPDSTHYQLPKLSNITTKDVSKIEISTAGTSIVLNKKEDKWHITPEGYAADADKVKGMLDVIKELTVTTLVSESKNYIRYDLGDDKKITVRAWTGGTLTREFEVGKVATSYRHTFVMLADDDRVYHARGNFRGRFDQTIERLRDKTVLSFDQSEIQEIHISKGEEAIVFARKEIPVQVSVSEEADAQSPPPPEVEMVWQTADGKAGDETRLSKLLTTLSNLKCEKYVDDRKKEDFANPICTIRLKGPQEYMLSIFAKSDKEAKNYPAVSSENDYPFLIPKWQADNLMKKPEELLKNPEEG